MKNNKLVQSGMIAAIYVLLSILFAPISFGVLQFRIAESMTILPVFIPQAIWGLTIGCLITNTWGVVMGLNVLGALDIILGTAATFIAAYISSKIKKLPLGALPPVVINALIIGAEITFAEVGTLDSKLLFINIGKLALEESICVFILGIPLKKVFMNVLQNTRKK